MSSPGELVDRAEALRAVLEDALVAWGRTGSTAWETQVRAATDRLAGALGTGADPGALLEVTDPVRSALVAATGDASLPGELAPTLREAVDFARELRALALEIVASSPVPTGHEEPIDEPPFHASRGVPASHGGLQVPSPDVLPSAVTTAAAADASLELGSLARGGAIVRSLPDDDGLDGLGGGGAGPGGGGRRRPPMTGERLQLDRLARGCMEDLAVLSVLRRCRDEDPWCDAERFERRILASLDALVALDRPRSARGTRLGVVERLWDYATEWSVPDGGRAFAFAFVMCCLDGAEAARWVMLALRRAPSRVQPAFEDALALGSSTSLDRVLHGLVREEPRTELLGVGLRSIRRRLAPDVPSLVPLLAHPDPEVARAAVAALAAAPREEIEAPLEGLLAGDVDTSIAAARVLTAMGSLRGVQHLREVLQRALADRGEDVQGLGREAAIGLAVVGEGRDAETLGAMARLQPAVLPWLGIHGFAMHVPVLLASLERDSIGEDARHVARAIHRITGLHPEGWSSASRDDVGVLPWKDCLAKAAEPPSGRLRFGQPHPAGSASVTAILEELAEGTTLQGERRRLVTELEFAARRPGALDVDGWTSAQRVAIGAATARR